MMPQALKLTRKNSSRPVLATRSAYLRLALLVALALTAPLLAAQAPGFAEIFERHGAIMLLIDPASGEIKEANPAAEGFYGYAQGAMRGMSIDRINTLSPEQIADERALAAQEGRNYFIFRHKLADGEIRTVAVRSHPFEFDGDRLLLSVIHDITPDRDIEHGLWHYQQRLEELVEIRTRESVARQRAVVFVLAVGVFALTVLSVTLWRVAGRRQRAERERLKDQQLLRSAIETIDEAFVIYDEDDRLVWCNDKYREIYPSVAHMMRPGVGFEDIVREWVAHGAPDVGDSDPEAWIAGRMELHRNGQIMIQHTDNDRWVRIIERTTPAGQIVGFRVDITELVKARKDAEAASVAKSRFLATMSHELRTPLNAMMGLAQSMLSQNAITEAQYKENAQSIHRSGQILLTLLNDILDLSKIEAGGLTLESGVVEPAGMLAEVHSLFSSIARDKLITLNATWHASPELRYEGDPHRLRQMLMNLVSNALKFTDQGEVSIDARPLLRSADESMLEFSVSDTGIGIPPERANQLFQPFSQLDDSNTRRFGGTGLGLSIVRSLALAMGGETGVESAPGKGTRFWFRVPLKSLAAGSHHCMDRAPASLANSNVNGRTTPNPEFELRVALERIKTLLPLLEKSKFDALWRFGDIETFVAGSPLGDELAAIRPLLEAFRFAETRSALERVLSKYKTGDNV